MMTAKELRQKILLNRLSKREILEELIKIARARTISSYNQTYGYLHELMGIGKDWSVSHNEWYKDQPFGANNYAPIRFDIMVDIAKRFRVKKGQTFYDLGAGRGLFINLLGMVSEGQIIGVEWFQPFVETSDEISAEFKLNNVKMIHDNVINLDYTDGNIFYMFNPFAEVIVDKVMNKLEKVAAKKKIKIIGICNESKIEIAYDRKTDNFVKRKWIKEIKTLKGMCIYNTHYIPAVVYESI